MKFVCFLFCFLGLFNIKNQLIICNKKNNVIKTYRIFATY